MFQIKTDEGNWNKLEKDNLLIRFNNYIDSGKDSRRKPLFSNFEASFYKEVLSKETKNKLSGVGDTGKVLAGSSGGYRRRSRKGPLEEASESVRRVIHLFAFSVFRPVSVTSDLNRLFIISVRSFYVCSLTVFMI